MSAKKHASPSPQKKSVLTLANKITILRILLIPVIVIGLLKHQSMLVYVILFFTMLTDFLDGLAARRCGEQTKLGAFLDPMADKLLLTSMYLTLTYLGSVDIWIFVVIFSRDLLIVLGWLVIFILTGSSHIQPRPFGKVTTAFQMGTALAIMLHVPEPLQHFLLFIMVMLTIASTLDYIRVGEKKLGETA